MMIQSSLSCAAVSGGLTQMGRRAKCGTERMSDEEGTLRRAGCDVRGVGPHKRLEKSTQLRFKMRISSPAFNPDSISSRKGCYPQSRITKKK